MRDRNRLVGKLGSIYLQYGWEEGCMAFMEAMFVVFFAGVFEGTGILAEISCWHFTKVYQAILALNSMHADKVLIYILLSGTCGILTSHVS